MIATEENLKSLVERFKKSGHYSVDTETTGLYPYLGDRLFSIIICDSLGSVYFNFKDYDDGSPYLPSPDLLKDIFSNKESYWFAHNAKFDMAMLRLEGIKVAGTVHCTQAIAKIIRNDKFNYSLDALSKEIGLKKSSAVEEYIKEHGLTKKVDIPGKKTRHTLKFYDQVPFDIISAYGITDGLVTRALGMRQLSTLAIMAAGEDSQKLKITDVFSNELAVTKACFKMEWSGIFVDQQYCKDASVYEKNIQDESKAEFEKIASVVFKDSAKVLSNIFDRFGLDYPRNEPTELMKQKALVRGDVCLGNPSFDSGFLKSVDYPIAKAVLKHRRAVKRYGTYYQSFLHFSDPSNMLHCNFKQDGTGTGRMSASEPNLQNVPKRGDDASEFPVRRAFRPMPGYCFVMLDYDQQEYRLMVDYAKELELIRKIKSGLDVHTATAELLGVSRTEAKTLNFMLIYGGGTAKLAAALNISLDRAQMLKDNYFLSMPQVGKFIKNVIKKAKTKGHITNWMGRRCYFEDPNFAYKAPNYLIQGGCADVVKKAMVGCTNLIEDLYSKLVLQIHDELVFEIYHEELYIVKDLVKIMEDAYPYKMLPLTVGVDHSWSSWHDKTKGYPK